MNFTARFLFLIFFSFGAFLEAADLSGKIIVLDAGHATKDSGENIINSGAKSKSGKLLERDITLAVAILMKPLLEAHGAKVYLTRTALNPWRYHETPSADNRARALFANALQADAYIRLHCDWNRKKTFEGFTNYYFRWGSRPLAKQIDQAMMQTLTEQRNNGVKRKSFVSVTSKMPTVLVELGVLSHKTDAERIGNPNYQARLAQAVSTGILNYFQTKN